MTRHLYPVPDVPEQPQRIDITALLHADIPGPEHWEKTHIKGDRREPVYLEWGGRGWRK